jgi:hypothetical protein
MLREWLVTHWSLYVVTLAASLLYILWETGGSLVEFHYFAQQLAARLLRRMRGSDQNESMDVLELPGRMILAFFTAAISLDLLILAGICALFD